MNAGIFFFTGSECSKCGYDTLLWGGNDGDYCDKFAEELKQAIQ